MFFSWRWHHPCGCGDFASLGACLTLASVKVTACRFHLLHLFLLYSMSPAGGGAAVVGVQMCIRLLRIRGRVLGEGGRAIVQPPCPLQATEDLVWQHQGGTWSDQNKNRSLPLLNPSLFGGGRRNQSVSSHCGGWVWLFVSAGGRQAGSVNAYHDHNRANEHSSAMKAQRERLRIPGLTLEWVFSSVILPGRQLLCSV